MLSNPNNNFQNYRRLLESSPSNIPYLTLVAKDIYFLTQNISFMESILTMAERCKIVTSVFPQLQDLKEADSTLQNTGDRKIGLNDPHCAVCCSGGRCEVLTGLSSLSTFNDEGKFEFLNLCRRPIKVVTFEMFQVNLINL